MYTQQFYIVANVLMVTDAFILIATGYIGYSISLEATIEGLVMGWYDFLGFVLFLMFANNYFMGSAGFYSAQRFSSTWSMIKALFIAVLLSFVLLSAGIVLIGINPFLRVYLITHFLTVIAALIVTRVTLYSYLDCRARTRFNSRQILLIGSADRVITMAEALNKQCSWGHQVAGCLNVDGQSNPRAGNIPVLGRLEDFDTILQKHQIDEVVFALPKDSSVDLGKYMLKCKITGVAVRIVPALFDLSDSSLRVESIQGIPTLTDYTAITSVSGLFYKKMLDLAAGLFGFMVFILFFPIMWLVIKLDSPCPVLFKQRRVGMHGRQFYLYKFRSMVADAESKKTDLLVEKKTAWPSYKTKHDSRITRVGRFLRKTSLDEFPQFINVLKGEMSLVGTRPPTPDEVKQYENWQRRRISIKPGITGLWQISGRKEITDFTEVVKLDLKYIDGWGFRNDLMILWKTVWVVLARKGAK